MKPHKYIMVAMSGGVDSSVSALLLKQQGYEVAGLFMKNWEEDDTPEYCSAAQDVADAKAVCDKIGIPLHTVNFAAEYWDNVFEHFLSEYRAGRTPNPDILCNKEIKFKAFLDYARDLGADTIATGHYVRKTEADGAFQLLAGLDPNKDQSYFLYTLNQQQLAPSLFPIGDLEKSVVRGIAAEAGLINHNKKDSTGICFIGERKFKSFLNQYITAQRGLMKTPEGETVGEHDGLMFYTIGQRQGLGIGGLKTAKESAWYVLEKDLDHNVLIVGQGDDHPLLYTQALICEQIHLVDDRTILDGLTCEAKTRYRQKAQPCQIKRLNDDNYLVIFDNKQKAVTPGQSIVFYQGEKCLGGGIISIRGESEKLLTIPVDNSVNCSWDKSRSY